MINLSNSIVIARMENTNNSLAQTRNSDEVTLKDTSLLICDHLKERQVGLGLNMADMCNQVGK